MFHSTAPWLDYSILAAACPRTTKLNVVPTGLQSTGKKMSPPEGETITRRGAIHTFALCLPLPSAIFQATIVGYWPCCFCRLRGPFLMLVPQWVPTSSGVVVVPASLPPSGCCSRKHKSGKMAGKKRTWPIHIHKKKYSQLEEMS